MPQRITDPTRRLLIALLSDPARKWYGLELMELAELSSGTAYPLLHRLTAEKWLTSSREDVDPRQEGRPRRRLYQLTALGVHGAQEALGEAAPATSAPPPRPRAVATPDGVRA